MDDEPKIAENEIWEMFGDVIPMSTASKLFPREGETPRTNKEMREMLHADAKEWWDSGKAQIEMIRSRITKTFPMQHEGFAFAGELKSLGELYGAFERADDPAVFPNGVTALTVIGNQIILKLVGKDILTFEDFQRNDNRKFTFAHIHDAVNNFIQGK